MRINRNMSAVLTNNYMKRTENRLSKSMEKLSSGFKINSAGDNPAGMAISNKMKAQIEGLKEAETNSSDAISTLQIADGALNEVSSMLQRIRELAVQSANGTNSDTDRDTIQAEVDQLVKEVDRISNSTEYNTKPLLDGTSDVRVYGQKFTRMNVSDAVITGDYSVAVTQKAEKAEISAESFSDMVLTGSIGIVDEKGSRTNISITNTLLNGETDEGTGAIADAINSAGIEGLTATVSGTRIQISLPEGYSIGMGSNTSGDIVNTDGGAYLDYSSIGVSGYISINDSAMEITNKMTEVQFQEALREAAAGGDCVLQEGYSSITSKQYGSSSEIVFTVSDNIEGLFSIETATSSYYDDSKKANVYTMNGKDAMLMTPLGSTFSSTATYHSDGNHVTITDRDGFSIDFLLDEDIELTDDSETGEEVCLIDIEVTDIGPMTVQIGANQYQSMEIRIPEISSKSMYLDWVDVTNEKGATESLEIMDSAITYLNDARSRIGAFQNRLEYAQNSLSESQEDMTKAYSNLLDTNMAEEMTEYTLQNVLDQASISVLAQANELPDKILSLLSR